MLLKWGTCSNMHLKRSRSLLNIVWHWQKFLKDAFLQHMYQMNNTIIIAWLPCMLYELCHEKMCLKIFVVVIYIVAVRSVRCVKRDQKGLWVKNSSPNGLKGWSVWSAAAVSAYLHFTVMHGISLWCTTILSHFCFVILNMTLMYLMRTILTMLTGGVFWTAILQWYSVTSPWLFDATSKWQHFEQSTTPIAHHYPTKWVFRTHPGHLSFWPLKSCSALLKNPGQAWIQWPSS